MSTQRLIRLGVIWAAAWFVAAATFAAAPTAADTAPAPAAGGTSARSFYHANWKNFVGLIKRGDVVIMQFGTNDGGDPTKSVGELRGIGDETQSITNRAGNMFTRAGTVRLSTRRWSYWASKS
jgi:hypothetical protein